MLMHHSMPPETTHMTNRQHALRRIIFFTYMVVSVYAALADIPAGWLDTSKAPSMYWTKRSRWKYSASKIISTPLFLYTYHVLFYYYWNVSFCLPTNFIGSFSLPPLNKWEKTERVVRVGENGSKNHQLCFLLHIY